MLDTKHYPKIYNKNLGIENENQQDVWGQRQSVI